MLPLLLAISYIEWLGSLTIIGTLGIGAYQDLKRREIDDWVWFLCIPAAVANAYGIYSGLFPYGARLWGAELGLLAAMGLAFYYLGLFGGADAKAMLAVGLALPFQAFPFHSQIPFFGLTVFDNGVVAAIIWSILFGVWNISRWARNRSYFGRYSSSSIGTKLGLVASAYRATVGYYLARSDRLFPAESISVDGQGIVSYAPTFRPTIEFEAEDSIKKLREEGKIRDTDELWVSPGLPLVTFMFAGLAFSALFGDSVFHIVSIIFRL